MLPSNQADGPRREKGRTIGAERRRRKRKTRIVSSCCSLICTCPIWLSSGGSCRRRGKRAFAGQLGLATTSDKLAAWEPTRAKHPERRKVWRGRRGNHGSRAGQLLLIGTWPRRAEKSIEPVCMRAGGSGPVMASAASCLCSAAEGDLCSRLRWARASNSISARPGPGAGH